MGYEVAAFACAEEEEEHHACGECCVAPSAIGLNAQVPPKSPGGEQTERAHDQTGRAEALVGATVDQEGQEIAASAGQEGGQEGRAGSVTAHGQAEQGDAAGEVQGEMGGIGMQPNGGEEAPPLSVPNGGPVHQTLLCIERGTALEQVKGSGDRGPCEAAPIEEESGGGQLAVPGTGSVFEFELCDAGPGLCPLVRGDPELPAVGGGFEGGFDALAEEDQAPIHGLAR